MFGMLDRLIIAGLYRLAPKVLGALAIVKPETVIKWHRAGFRSYWRWKSRRRGGRPTVAPEIRKLIREMSIANPLWGAPRIPLCGVERTLSECIATSQFAPNRSAPV